MGREFFPWALVFRQFANSRWLSGGKNSWAVARSKLNLTPKLFEHFAESVG